MRNTQNSSASPTPLAKQQTAAERHALALAALGIHVAPVWNNHGKKTCRCAAGRACTTPGTHLHDDLCLSGRGTADPQLIRLWFELDSDAGLAISLRESGLVALRVDNLEGCEAMSRFWNASESFAEGIRMTIDGVDANGRWFYLLEDREQHARSLQLPTGMHLECTGLIPISPTRGSRRARWRVSPFAYAPVPLAMLGFAELVASGAHLKTVSELLKEQRSPTTA